MKKALVILLAVCLVLGLAACAAKVECDFCGEKKVCSTKEFLGQKVNICKDCQKDLKELGDGLQGLFG